MDEDVDQMSPEQLVTEVKRLRQGIRQHRDGTGHDLCWHHPALWGLLPDETDPPIHLCKNHILWLRKLQPPPPSPLRTCPFTRP